MVSQLKGGGQAGMATARKRSLCCWAWVDPYHLEDFIVGDEGFTKLLFDEVHHWMLDGGIVVTHVGDLIGKVCFAGEMGGDPIDVGKPMRIRHCASRSGWREAFKECAPI